MNEERKAVSPVILCDRWADGGQSETSTLLRVCSSLERAQAFAAQHARQALA